MPTTRSKDASKVQSRLGFSPISKDSAQAQELSPAVRSRASAVRYYSPREDNERQTRTTIAGSSTTRTSLKNKQQKLQLEPSAPRRSTRLIQSDGLADDDADIQFSQRRSSPGPYRNLPSSSARARRSSPGLDEDEVELVSTRPKRATHSSPLPPLTSSPPGAISSEDDEDNQIASPVRSRKRIQVLDDHTSDEEFVDDEALLPSNNRHDAKANGNSDEEVVSLPTSPKRLRNTTRKILSLNPNDTRARSDSDNLHEPSSSRKSRRSNIIISEDEDENNDDSDGDSAIVISTSAGIVRRRQVMEEDDEDLGSSSPIKKRRLQHGSRPRRITREEEDEEVLEDAQDLRDTDTFNDGLRSASKLNSKKAARQRELAKLQKRRQKAKTTSSVIELSSSSPSPEPELPLPYNDGYSDDNSSQADSIINDDVLSEDGNASESSEIRMNRNIYSMPSALYYIIQSILYDKFIPPSQQTTNESSDTEDNPKPVSAAYYLAAHNLIDKQLEGYRNQFISSVWRKPFVAGLYARPKLTWPRNAITLWESCEACGRRDRPASYAIRFEGNCYEESTLEEFESDSEEEDELDGDGNYIGSTEGLKGVWAKYNEKVPRTRIWHVGSDCHDNAWRAHRAAHWKFGLNGPIDKVLEMMKVDVAVGGRDNNRQSGGNHAESSSGHRVLNDKELLEQEDRFHATLLQMEEQGYMRALTDEFLERFEMAGDEDDDEDD